LKDIWRGKKGICVSKEKKNRITIEELSGLRPLQIFLCTLINHGERKKEILQPKKKPHYITCTSLLFSFFKVGLERTKGLGLFNDIMPGKYYTWGSILPPQRQFNSVVRECFFVCRQSTNRENSVCSLKIVQNIPDFVKILKLHRK